MKKNNEFSPYATNRGGKIESPRPKTADARSNVIRGEDMRAKAKKNSK